MSGDVKALLGLVALVVITYASWWHVELPLEYRLLMVAPFVMIVLMAAAAQLVTMVFTPRHQKRI